MNTHNMFSLRNKKNIYSITPFIELWLSIGAYIYTYILGFEKIYICCEMQEKSSYGKYEQ